MLAGQTSLTEDSNFKITRGGDIQHTQHKLALALGQAFQKQHEAGAYDPEQDIILSPFNKQDLGTDMMNKHISQFLGQKRNAVVHEIICGINKIYVAVGDKVLYNKQVGYITNITRNSQYLGKTPKQASEFLTRFGTYIGTPTGEGEFSDFELAGYENIPPGRSMPSCLFDR